MLSLATAYLPLSAASGQTYEKIKKRLRSERFLTGAPGEARRAGGCRSTCAPRPETRALSTRATRPDPTTVNFRRPRPTAFVKNNSSLHRLLLISRKLLRGNDK
ncbi:hypothetical protein J6590_008513 [Homalodisca vitripennis]|nr:hypothetical protein J6590_008513 [Homalodisca vitripennis]